MLLLWGGGKIKKPFVCWGTGGLRSVALFCFSIWGGDSGKWDIGYVGILVLFALLCYEESYPCYCSLVSSMVHLEGKESRTV